MPLKAAAKKETIRTLNSVSEEVGDFFFKQTMTMYRKMVEGGLGPQGATQAIHKVSSSGIKTTIGNMISDIDAITADDLDKITAVIGYGKKTALEDCVDERIEGLRSAEITAVFDDFQQKIAEKLQPIKDKLLPR